MSIVSMTVLIDLMDAYHLCVSEKLYFYAVYIAVILLLDSCMEATICRKKDSACMTYMCIESRGRGFFTFT
jgi:hypothetical protein